MQATVGVLLNAQVRGVEEVTPLADFNFTIEFSMMADARLDEQGIIQETQYTHYVCFQELRCSQAAY